VSDSGPPNDTQKLACLDPHDRALKLLKWLFYLELLLMPTYDYRCEINDRVVEVSHRMRDTLTTWGELCACAGLEPGDTSVDAPVHRLATGGNVISSHHLGSGNAPSCATGSCCAGGMCGLN
jgi:hypothetical protein